MPETEHFTFMLPPNAWSKKPYPSTFKMTREEAAQRYPGAEPILSSREVRKGSGAALVAAKDELYGRKHG